MPPTAKSYKIYRKIAAMALTGRYLHVQGHQQINTPSKWPKFAAGQRYLYNSQSANKRKSFGLFLVTYHRIKIPVCPFDSPQKLGLILHCGRNREHVCTTTAKQRRITERFTCTQPRLHTVRASEEATKATTAMKGQQHNHNAKLLGRCFGT